MANQPYSIFDPQVGLDAWFRKDGAELGAPSIGEESGNVFPPLSTGGGDGLISDLINNPINPADIPAGELGSLIGHGKKTFADTTAGFLMGLASDGTYKWIIGTTGSSIDWNVTTANTLTVAGTITATTGTIGGFSIGSDYIRDAANSFGLASTVTGGDDVRFWAGNSFANRASAPFRLTEAGVLTATSATITGTITATGGAIGGFSIGSDYIRDAANSFGMASTVTGGDDVRFWAGDTFANRATAPFRITEAGVLVGTSVTVTGTIQATGGYVGSTTALIYEAQGINTGTTGHIRGGQTDYETGTGYFLGYSTAAYKFSIGIGGSSSDNLHWDGTNLFVNGSLIRNQDIYGDGSDGDVTISADTSLSTDMFYNNLTINTTKTLNSNGYRIFVKGVLTTNGTGKLARTGNTGGNGADATGLVAGQGAGGTAAAALADGSIKGAIAGTNGVTGVTGVVAFTNAVAGTVGTAGTGGTSVAKSLVTSDGLSGGSGGTGGNATSASGTGNGQAGGAGGSGGTRTGTVYNLIHNSIAAYRLYDDNGTAFLTAAPSNGSGGSGGSGGASSPRNNSAGSGSTGGSGASGGQGGIVVVFARTIVNSGTISADGGVGGNAGTTFASAAPLANEAAGGSAGSCGGDGGNGGVVILVYSSLTNTGTIQAAGGVGGTKSSGKAAATNGTGSGTAGTDGANGTTGNSGVVIQLQV